jgi:hypothetical protein
LSARRFVRDVDDAKAGHRLQRQPRFVGRRDQIGEHRMSRDGRDRRAVFAHATVGERNDDQTRLEFREFLFSPRKTGIYYIINWNAKHQNRSGDQELEKKIFRAVGQTSHLSQGFTSARQRTAARSHLPEIGRGWHRIGPASAEKSTQGSRGQVSVVHKNTEANMVLRSVDSTFRICVNETTARFSVRSLRRRDGTRAMDSDGSCGEQATAGALLLLVLELRTHTAVVIVHRRYAQRCCCCCCCANRLVLVYVLDRIHFNANDILEQKPDRTRHLSASTRAKCSTPSSLAVRLFERTSNGFFCDSV